MNIVTALTAQKRNQERLNVYIDGRYAFSLAIEAAAGLTIGQSLTEADLTALQAADTYARAKTAAQRLLSYRPRSVAEVTQKLVQKGYDDLVIDRVVQHLQETALLDDAAFAAYWVEQRQTFRPRSRLALRDELRRKGVKRQIIETAVAAIDEHEAARRAAAAKVGRWHKLPPETFRQKAGQYLQRRGFSYDIIKSVVQELWQSVAEAYDSTTETKP
jgi:regulatory protein